MCWEEKQKGSMIPILPRGTDMSFRFKLREHWSKEAGVWIISSPVPVIIVSALVLQRGPLLLLEDKLFLNVLQGMQLLES